jgi:hypothetical protein
VIVLTVFDIVGFISECRIKSVLGPRKSHPTGVTSDGIVPFWDHLSRDSDKGEWTGGAQSKS